MSEMNYWTNLHRRRFSRRTMLGASAKAGVGAAGLALVGCGDDDDDSAAADAGGAAAAAEAAAAAGDSSAAAAAAERAAAAAEEAAAAAAAAGDAGAAAVAEAAAAAAEAAAEAAREAGAAEAGAAAEAAAAAAAAAEDAAEAARAAAEAAAAGEGDMADDAPAGAFAGVDLDATIVSVTNRDGGGLDQVRSGSHVNYVSHYSIHSSPIWLEGDTLDLQDNVFTVPEQPDPVTYITNINPFPYHDPSYGTYSAHDAQFTFERAGNIAAYHDGGKATDHPGGWTSARSQYGAQNWAGNEVLDDTTWKVVLNGVDAAFFVVNFSGDVQLVSKQYTETVGDAEMDKAPMGTGPYRFVSHADDTDFIFTRFEGHYFPMEQFGSNRPHVPVNKDLEILVRPEVLSWIAGVEAGEIDVAPGLGFNDIKSFLDDPDYTVEFQAAGAAAVHNLYFNTHVTELEDGTPNPFHDIRVRQAANHAVNREAIATGLMSGTEEQPLFHFSGSNGYPTPEQKAEVLFEYDPDKSRALMAEAGFPDGFDTTLHIPAGFGQNVDELSLIVQQELNAIGIRLEIREVTAGEYFTDAEVRARPGKPGIWWFFANTHADIGSMVNCCVKPDGVYSVSPASEAVLALVQAEENELDPAKRKELITELFLQHAREATFLFLIEPKEGVLLRSGVVWPAGAKQRRAITGCYPVHKLV